MWDRQRLVRELRTMVAIKSNYYEEQPLLDYLFGWLAARGLHPERHQYRESRITGFAGENLVLRLKGEPGGPRLCLNGHADTVPLCAGWSRDPYGGEVADGLLYGLGAADMKGGVLALLLAVERLLEEKQPFYGEIILTVVSDEEGPYGLGTNALIEDGLLEGVDCALCTEPTAAFAGVSDAPVISPGARGTYIYQADFYGRACHASQPEQGLNAAEQAALFAVAATRAQPSLAGELGHGSLCLLKMAADGGACSAPDFARVTIHRHVNELEDEQSVLAEAERFCQEAGVSCAHKIYLRETPSAGSRAYLPYVVPADNRYLRLLNQAVTEAAGQPPRQIHFASIGDFNYLGTRLNGAPCLIFGPAGGNLHAPDEYVSLSSLEMVTEGVYRFLKLALTPGCP